jgi:hypothetical protein
MAEHLGTIPREQLTAGILAMCDYACEWADDATLFALMAVLAQHASQVAQRLQFQQSRCEESTIALQQLAAARTHAETGLGSAVPMPAQF